MVNGPSLGDVGNFLARAGSLGLGASFGFPVGTGAGRELGETLAFVGGEPARAAADLSTAVLAARELIRAQLPVARRLVGDKLEGISAVGGRLAVQAGLAATMDDGIVLFHEQITTDKPSLRRILRKNDERAGRRPRARRSAGQKIVALAVKGGLVKRNKNGTFKRLAPAATRLLKRERSRKAAARNKERIRKQSSAREKLKGFR